jgi:hypothetical protein
VLVQDGGPDFSRSKVQRARDRRSRTLRTVAACQRPCAGVLIPRLFNSAAAARADMCASSASTGRNASARARASALVFSDCALRPPSFTPLRLAAASSALVRSEMSRRSFSASAA